MPESKLISPRRIVDALRSRATAAIANADFWLQQLKENRIDWLVASNALDQQRRDLRMAALAFSDLVEPDEYTELQSILADALLKIDQAANEMISKYLLNGPKAVQS